MKHPESQNYKEFGRAAILGSFFFFAVVDELMRQIAFAIIFYNIHKHHLQGAVISFSNRILDRRL